VVVRRALDCEVDADVDDSAEELDADIVCTGDLASVLVDEVLLVVTVLPFEAELELLITTLLLTDDETGESLYICNLFPAPQYSY
jgi:hypothetical protein